MPRRSKDDISFASVLEAHLDRHNLKQIDLVRAHGVNPGYISRIAGSVGASPGTVNKIVNSTSANAMEKYQLHIAAAQGKGYDIADYVRRLETENADLRRQLAERNKC